MGIRTEMDAFHSECPKVYQLAQFGDKVDVALVTLLINDLADSLNIGKNMGAQQVIDCAQLAVDEFRQAKISDFVCCFAKVKKGAYGTVYDRLDVQMIFSWLNRYFADQTEQIEFWRQNENAKIKRQTRDIPLFDENAADGTEKNAEALERIRAIKNSLAISSPKPATNERTQTASDRLFSKWMAQFNKAFERMYYDASGNALPNKREPSGTRFVRRYGRMLDITGFLRHKEYQYQLARKRWK